LLTDVSAASRQNCNQKPGDLIAGYPLRAAFALVGGVGRLRENFFLAGFAWAG
jgi:hypothetical protein